MLKHTWFKSFDNITNTFEVLWLSEIKLWQIYNRAQYCPKDFQVTSNNRYSNFLTFFHVPFFALKFVLIPWVFVLLVGLLRNHRFDTNSSKSKLNDRATIFGSVDTGVHPNLFTGCSIYTSDTFLTLFDWRSKNSRWRHLKRT